MEFRAFHGCYDLEKKVGNRFLVKLSIDAELGDAAQDDDVSKTVNYLTAYEVVAGQMRVVSNTLENVTSRIIDAVYEAFPQIVRITATVSKRAPPLGGKLNKVSGTMTK